MVAKPISEIISVLKELIALRKSFVSDEPVIDGLRHQTQEHVHFMTTNSLCETTSVAKLTIEELAQADNETREQYFDSHLCKGCGLMPWECPAL
jgi:hypothetical protein